nr:hypothetical protein [Nitrosopumilus sp.]
MSIMTFLMLIGITFSFPTIQADSFDKEITMKFSGTENPINSTPTEIQHVLKLHDVVNISNNENPNSKQNNEKIKNVSDKIGIVKLHDVVSVSGNDKLAESIVHLKYDSDKKTSRERILNFEKVSFDGKSIQIVQEETEKNTISVLHDDLIFHIDQNYNQPLISVKQENTIFFLFDSELDDFRNIDFLSEYFIAFDNSWNDESNIINPTMLLLLVPLSGVVLFSNESKKNVLRISKRTQSFSLIFLLLFSATSTPFMISDDYWGNAYAEEFSFEGLIEDASSLSNINSTSTVIESNSTSTVIESNSTSTVIES